MSREGLPGKAIAERDDGRGGLLGAAQPRSLGSPPDALISGEGGRRPGLPTALPLGQGRNERV
eukprot:286134-Alexandrium_andersonii.AAC.1